MFKYIMIISVVLFSIGCKAEIEPEQIQENYGKIFIIVSWSWDVENVNMNNSTVNQYEVFEIGIEYELKKNSKSRMSWDSFETKYSGILDIKNGAEGKDTIYSLFLSGNNGTLTLEGYR